MAGRSRSGWWLAGVLALVATGLWVAALLRVRDQVAARPARERFLTWVTPDGPLGRHPSFPHCAGPAIVTTDRAWRTCYLSGGSDPDRYVIVRFELDRRRAMMIPLPESVNATWATAAAVSPDGELALIASGTLLRLRGDEVSVVGAVSDHEVAGIAWVDGAIEVVQGRIEPELLRFGEVSSRRALPEPPVDRAGERSPWLAQAWRDPQGWRLLFEMRYRGLDQAPLVEVELLEGDPGGAAWASTRVPADPRRSQASLDGARSGLLLWTSPDWRSYQRRDGAGWTPFVHPTPAQADEYEQITADYLIGADGLTAMHRIDELSHGAVETPDGWLGLASEYDGTDSYLRLHDLGGDAGPRAVRWGWIDHRAVPVPASAGGWWLLGTFGTYIRVDGVRRVDAPDTLGRFRQLSANLDRLGMYSDWYGQGAFLKRAAFPIVLLGWPVAALAALLSWLLVRRRAVSLSSPLATAMGLYAAVALLLIKTFWDITGRM